MRWEGDGTVTEASGNWGLALGGAEHRKTLLWAPGYGAAGAGAGQTSGSMVASYAAALLCMSTQCALRGRKFGITNSTWANRGISSNTLTAIASSISSVSRGSSSSSKWTTPSQWKPQQQQQCQQRLAAAAAAVLPMVAAPTAEATPVPAIQQQQQHRQE